MSQSNHTARDFLHRLRLLEGFLDREVERLSLFLTMLQKRLEDLRFLISLLEGKERTHAMNGPIRIDRGPDTSFPAQVARKLRVAESIDSSLWFEIDESGHWFTLQDRVAGLLKFLVSDLATDRDGDGLMPVYSRKSVLEYLTATGNGRKYEASFVHKMVNKLGEALRHHDARNLVESSKEGIRFRVRRSGVEFVKLDKPPLEVVRRRPQPRFLQMAVRPATPLERMERAQGPAAARSPDSEDHI